MMLILHGTAAGSLEGKFFGALVKETFAQHNKQFLLFLQCFQNTCNADT